MIAIVPDAAVRVMLVEFDTLPSDQEEALGVVRFRLKKSLPFDVDKAKVSYHAQKVRDEIRVVAAVAMGSVIDDYESVHSAMPDSIPVSCCPRRWQRWAQPKGKGRRW